MRKVLIDLWFPHNQYDILDYTNVYYRFVYLYEKQYCQNIKGQTKNQNDHNQVLVSRKEKCLKIDKMQSISKENFEVVEKYQDLQQVVELKFKDSTFQNFNEEIKEKKIELIVDNGINQEMVIIENIVEDPIEVKYEDESIIHNLQVPVDLLKMTT